MSGMQIGRTDDHPASDTVELNHRQGGCELIVTQQKNGFPRELRKVPPEACSMEKIG
jgi:hypothetical protein